MIDRDWPSNNIHNNVLNTSIASSALHLGDEDFPLSSINATEDNTFSHHYQSEEEEEDLLPVNFSSNILQQQNDITTSSTGTTFPEENPVLKITNTIKKWICFICRSPDDKEDLIGTLYNIYRSLFLKAIFNTNFRNFGIHSIKNRK